MIDLLLPRRCVCCGCVGDGLCPRCATSLPAAPDLEPPPGLAACWSLVDHVGAGRDVVASLKYRGRGDAVDQLARAMASMVDRPVGVVTWAPTSAGHRRRRGFDQAEVLARSVARSLRCGCSALLRRTTSLGQTGRNRAERLRGPSFAASDLGRPAPPGPVLLVDDVRTTGATLCAAADALTLAGRGPVLGLTLSVRRPESVGR